MDVSGQNKANRASNFDILRHLWRKLGTIALIPLFSAILLVSPAFAKPSPEFIPKAKALSLVAWQPTPSHPIFILPQKKGETPQQAVGEYLTHVLRDLDVSGDGPGPGILKAPEKEWIFHDLGAVSEPPVLLVANRQDDHIPGDARMIEMTQPLLKRQLKPFLLPVGAGVRLEKRSERKAFHRELSQVFKGIVFLGGADLAPRTYRRVSTYARAYNEFRDRLEIKIAKDYIAMSEGFVLGICRGAQLLNVAFGGNMVQDIEKILHSPVRHGVGEDGEPNFHNIRLLPTERGLLAQALGYQDLSQAVGIEVTTYHHQAIKVKPGGPVRVAAVGDDGVVEAIEIGDRVLGLQSHPERAESDGKTSFGDAVFDFFASRVRSTIPLNPPCETILKAM